MVHYRFLYSGAESKRTGFPVGIKLLGSSDRVIAQGRCNIWSRGARGYHEAECLWLVIIGCRNHTADQLSQDIIKNVYIYIIYKFSMILPVSGSGIRYCLGDLRQPMIISILALNPSLSHFMRSIWTYAMHPCTLTCLTFSFRPDHISMGDFCRSTDTERLFQ